MLKIMLRKLKKAGALMLILLFAAFPISTQAVVSEVENVKNSVVRIYTEDSTGAACTGSGFYIGKKDGYQYYVTNDHCVSRLNERTGRILDSASVIIFSDKFTATDCIVAEPVYQTYQEGIDLAVVRIPDNGEEKRTPVTLKSCESLSVTDTVYVLGFPGGADILSDSQNALESNPKNVIITKGAVTNTELESDSTDCILIDAAINGGNSGGPVVDENGNVIGIATFVAAGAEAINGAIKSDELIEILESKGFPCNTSSSSSETPKTTEKQTKSSKTAKSKSYTPVFDGMNEKTKTNLYILLGVLIFFVLVLVLVIIVVMMKKSSKKKNPKNNDWKNQNRRTRL